MPATQKVIEIFCAEDYGPLVSLLAVYPNDFSWGWETSAPGSKAYQLVTKWLPSSLATLGRWRQSLRGDR